MAASFSEAAISFGTVRSVPAISQRAVLSYRYGIAGHRILRRLPPSGVEPPPDRDQQTPSRQRRP